jgi:hypothetical protein
MSREEKRAAVKLAFDAALRAASRANGLAACRPNEVFSRPS